jgi:hypothetical protein
VNAKEILDASAQAEKAKQDYAVELRKTIADANAELVALGLKRVRKPREPKAKRGRPVKVKLVPVPEV